MSALTVNFNSIINLSDEQFFWDALNQEQKDKFALVCPDFVVVVHQTDFDV
jgi:hypothetical protein